jgi:L-Ala-D/L-Glu epimerase
VTLRLQMRPFRLPLRAPLLTARGRQGAVEGLRLLLTDGEGGYGLGEVTPLASFGTETLAEAVEALEALRLGPAPEAVGDVAAAFALPEGARASRAGVEMALLDWLARRRGVAVARWLGAPAVQAVEVNALLGADDPDELALEAQRRTASGFRTLKVKVGRGSPAADAVRLAAVREAVGPAVQLRVDANGAWTEAEARVRLAALLPVRLEYVEQPVPPEDVAGLRRLRTLLSVAADEALGLVGGPSAVLDGAEGPAADILVLKLPVLAGMLSALQLGLRAQARGLGTVVSSAMDGAVGRAAGAHLALALGGPWAHGLATGELLLEDPGALELSSGALQLRDVEGLGIPPEALGW